MQDFSVGGPTIKKNDFGSCGQRAVARGVWWYAPKENKKNGAISCVLRAIFNHFHDKKSSQKIVNKQEFFH